MNKRKRQAIKRVKRVIHQDLIGPCVARGISMSVVYKTVSAKLGYTFHCADIDERTDIEHTIKVITEVVHRLDLQYKNIAP